MSISRDDATAVLLRRLACRTYTNLHNAFELNVARGEETITDNLILDLMLRVSPDEFRCRGLTKDEESRWGADLELWIGKPSCGWLRYALQAKKLDLKKKRYRQLRKKVRGKQQIDILSAYASNFGAIGGYLFYNSGLSRLPANASTGAVVQDYGCTYASLNVVRPVHKSGKTKSFSAVHEGTSAVPWHRLIKHHCELFTAIMGGKRRQFIGDFLNGIDTANVWTGEELPRAVADFLRGDTDELPEEYFPDREAIPRRVAALTLSDVSGGSYNSMNPT